MRRDPAETAAAPGAPAEPAGEAVGLRWTELDLEAGTLTVSRQTLQLGARIQSGEPKSESGARIVALEGRPAADPAARPAARSGHLGPGRRREPSGGSEMLVHSTVATTADTYTSVLPDVAREAAEAAVRLVPRATSTGHGVPHLAINGHPRRGRRGTKPR